MGSKGTKYSSPSGENKQGKTREARTSELGAEVLQKKEGNPEKGVPGKQAQGQEEIPSQGSDDSLLLVPNEPVTEVTLKQTSKQIGSSIVIFTPLQFTKGNPNARWISMKK
jgi:hypothetical protein